MYEYIITINNGLSEISSEEVYRITGRKPYSNENILRFKGSEDDAYKLIIWGRTIHRVLLLIDEGVFNDMDDLSNKIGRTDLQEYFKKGSKFALKTTRYGEHSFTSIDVNKVIGGVIHSKLISLNMDPKVDLENPDIQFILRIIDDKYMFTVNLSGESLHVRGYRKYNHPASIKTSIASAMILLSGWRDQDLIDPMAGGGTIPIEAAMIKYRYAPGLYRDHHPIINIPIFDEERYMAYRREAYELRINDRLDTKIIYNDISKRYLEGAMLNARSAYVDKYIDFYLYDARMLSKYNIKIDEDFIVVSNPPYGIRMTRDKIIPRLYGEVVNELSVLGCSKIVVITSSWRYMLSALEKNGFKIVKKLKIKHGKLDTFILYAVS